MLRLIDFALTISTVPDVSEDGVDDRVVAFVGLLVAVQNGTFRSEGVAPFPLVVHVGPADNLAAKVKSELLRQLETKMCLVQVEKGVNNMHLQVLLHIV